MTADQAERIASALERIATACETFLTPPTETPEPACPHPPDARVDFGVTDGVHDWLCRACGYRTVATGD